MKSVRSYVLVEFDKEDKKLIDAITNKVHTEVETWAGIGRLFVHAEYDNDGGWKFTDLAHPQMSRAKLLADIRKSRARLASIDEALDLLAQRVKDTA